MAINELAVTVSPVGVDWVELYDLVGQSFSYMQGRIDPPSSFDQMTVDDFEAKAKTETLVIATRAGRLVGCVFCRREGDWLYVGKMAVAPRVQGEGIGRALLDRAFELARLEKCAGLELETRIELVENHAAFARTGFVKVAETSHAGFDRPTGITMRAELS